MNKIALIPAYEPDEELLNVVTDLHNNNYRIVIVDDGSGENYKDVFNKCQGAKVISYKENKGKGHALKTGLKYIKENFSNYIVVTVDADGQHKVKDANKLLSYVEKNKDTLALGSRKRNKNTPLRSKLGNTITMLVFKLATGSKIYDTQTGLRAFSDQLIDYLLKIEGNRYEYEMNVLLNLNKNNIKYKEIEIETIYFDGNSKSHFKTIRDSYLVYKKIIKFSLSSILSFIIDYVLYSVLFLITSSIVFSNVIARIVSGGFNYLTNKKLVFKSYKKNTLYSYIALAIAILVLNTIIIYFITRLIGINAYIAKIITEIVLFIVSYTVQKKYIFNK